jgi:drug/metabolite transporter (DMT)-like permease
MLKPLAFALLAALGNALFVFGQRGATQGANPFAFTFAAVGVCFVLMLVAVALNRTPGDGAYLASNWWQALAGGAGFFITFVGFFLLYSQYGATYYALYAVLSILTTSFGVGVLVYREPLNGWQIAALVLAILAIALFTYGRAKGG